MGTEPISWEADFRIPWHEVFTEAVQQWREKPWQLLADTLVREHIPIPQQWPAPIGPSRQFYLSMRLAMMATVGNLEALG